ncbi:carboxypeptidase-like regulatory domain-containing protein [Enterovibrio baiacu]|uniref:carboxypeptidase-like regulatory domain-containing protein n=1 Tax=Enterovibrio baiacu TaxID=2491023 RepID=UPI003D0CF553
MENTFEYATTPLALASLVSILVIGLLRLLSRGKDNALNRIITHYGFSLVLLFGLVGNGIYLFDSYQSSETLIIGTVIDKNSGKYLPRVQVDTGGHARGMTSDTGDFVLAIPKSRVADQYQISASLDGYKRQIATIDNEAKMFVRFELEKLRLDTNTALEVADARLIIGHYLGLPEVQINIKFNNPLTSQIAFKDLQLDVVSPSGVSRRLIQTSASVDSFSPILPPLPSVIVDPSKTVQFMFRFLQYDAHSHQLAIAAQTSLQSDSKFKYRGPQVGSNLLSQELTDRLESSLETSWFWEAGNSTINVSANINGDMARFSRVVSISSEQIEKMKAISNYYQAGFGIYPQVNLSPVGSAIPGHQIESSAL